MLYIVPVASFTDNEDVDGLLEVDRLRRDDFSNLYHPQQNPDGIIYLDHAGATLYAESQLTQCHQVRKKGRARQIRARM